MLFCSDTILKLYGWHGREGGFLCTIILGQGFPEISFIAYIESVNQIYNKYFGKDILDTIWVNQLQNNINE